jgi:TM2 domain-containing membrane protein YozV
MSDQNDTNAQAAQAPDASQAANQPGIPTQPAGGYTVPPSNPTGMPDVPAGYTAAGQGYQVPPQAPYQPAYQTPYGGNTQPNGPAWSIGSQNKDKWVAFFLAIFLGWLGIHKFYLGYKTSGIIMIVVSIAGSICAGLGLLIMEIIAIIEAVNYVIRTQEDFEQRYVYNEKAWF